MSNQVHEKLRLLDKFYTKPKVACDLVKGLVEALPEGMEKPLFVEPSAGSGAFLDALGEREFLAFDICPDDSRIAEANFLELDLALPGRNIVTIGNPPFGKNSSLAVKFFNHAAKFSDVIAFILPRTFMKESIQSRCDRMFHVERIISLDENSFTFDGRDYKVPCVFQIWLKREQPRKVKISPREHPDFRFTTKEAADIAVQRVGSRAGMLRECFGDRSPSSHYFISFERRSARKVFFEIDWSRFSRNTAGNPSISKTEIVRAYCEAAR